MAKQPTFKHAIGWMAVCCTLVAGFEGLYVNAYPDRLAHNLPTVCYGETEGVKLGDHYTAEQCIDMLAAKLPRYYSEIERCIHVPINDNERAAYTSFAYNVGSAGFCRSHTAKLLNQGHHKQACEAMLSWSYASGKYIPGLHRRRVAERDLCLKPVAPKPVEKATNDIPVVPNVPLDADHSGRVHSDSVKPSGVVPKEPEATRNCGWHPRCWSGLSVR